MLRLTDAAVVLPLRPTQRPSRSRLLPGVAASQQLVSDTVSLSRWLVCMVELVFFFLGYFGYGMFFFLGYLCFFTAIYFSHQVIFDLPDIALSSHLHLNLPVP